MAPELSVDRLFAGLEAASGLLLAVSGGPDSMALMLLARRWAGAGPRPPLFTATVDHGLRPQSRAEADMVAAAAAARGLPHATLTWDGPKPTTRIQERARAVRYQLLAAQARLVGASHVVTAHHADDQAETILFRLGRGSGLAGLAGMRPLVALKPGLALVRPLLGLRKAALVAVCQEDGCPYVEDPSNEDLTYARARLRAAVPALSGVGLDTPLLLRLAHRLGRADAALEAETDRAAAHLLSAVEVGTARLDFVGAAALPAEIRLRLVGRAVALVAGDRHIRLERLEVLVDRLAMALATGVKFRATLAGTCVSLGLDGQVDVRPEGLRRRGLQRPD